MHTRMHLQPHILLFRILWRTFITLLEVELTYISESHFLHHIKDSSVRKQNNRVTTILKQNNSDYIALMYLGTCRKMWNSFYSINHTSKSNKLTYFSLQMSILSYVIIKASNSTLIFKTATTDHSLTRLQSKQIPNRIIQIWVYPNNMNNIT